MLFFFGIFINLKSKPKNLKTESHKDFWKCSHERLKTCRSSRYDFGAYSIQWPETHMKALWKDIICKKLCTKTLCVNKLHSKESLFKEFRIKIICKRIACQKFSISRPRDTSCSRIKDLSWNRKRERPWRALPLYLTQKVFLF